MVDEVVAKVAVPATAATSPVRVNRYEVGEVNDTPTRPRETGLTRTKAIAEEDRLIPEKTRAACLFFRLLVQYGGCANCQDRGT